MRLFDFFGNGIRELSFFCTLAYGTRAVTQKRIDEAGYYRARAVDMMAKAQAASSKATRVAYLNLARVWARNAVHLEKGEPQSQAPNSSANPESARAEQKK
jgi:hypothetical protein